MTIYSIYMQLIFKGCLAVSSFQTYTLHTITHTQILDDPSGNSFVENQLAPSPNPDLTTEFYPRSEEQNRDLGLLSTAAEVSWAVCLFFFTVIILRVSRLSTILSRATAHGGLQLKCQKLGVASYLEELLKWFNFPHTKAHPGCEVSCQGIPNLPASSLCPCFIKARPAVEKAVLCYKAD